MSWEPRPLIDVWRDHRGRPALKVDTYIDAQERHLARYVGTRVHLVEIGVFFGGSLEIWRDYLGPDAHITGVDIDPRCAGFASERIEVLIGDQSDRGFLSELAARPIDVLIDDGGHRVSQQRATFEALFQSIADDGVYICEDTATSYWSKFGPGSFVDDMKARVDDLHRWFYDTPNQFTCSAASVHFYPAMVVVEKAPMCPPQMIANTGDGVQLSPYMANHADPP